MTWLPPCVRVGEAFRELREVASRQIHDGVRKNPAHAALLDLGITQSDAARVVRRALGSKFADEPAFHLREAGNTGVLSADLPSLFDFLVRVGGPRPAEIHDSRAFAPCGYKDFLVAPPPVAHAHSPAHTKTNRLLLDRPFHTLL